MHMRCISLAGFYNNRLTGTLEYHRGFFFQGINNNIYKIATVITTGYNIRTNLHLRTMFSTVLLLKIMNLLYGKKKLLFSISIAMQLVW